ncbi:MAG: transcriptional repressor NrdR [Spirochaetales bacterium]|nr:transcriptional repressor NrdR [Spirochaetales bacterium]
MKCPRCSCPDDKVLESRMNKEGTSLRRRRECLKCGFRYTTYERYEERPIIVTKKDGRLQNFDRSKIERGIRTCTEKLKIDEKDLQQVLDRIEEEINELAGSSRVVTSQQIGEITLKEIYTLSPVAYVRFAAVYRAFDDLSQFINEIERLRPKK